MADSSNPYGANRMSTKYATDKEKDKSADRPDRQTPTGRVSTPYEVVKAHGVESPDFTEDQTTRSHSEAKDPEAIAQGAFVPGEDGVDGAKRRFAAIHKRRQETAATFAANRKKSSIVRKK
jgi:hypothetical protein